MTSPHIDKPSSVAEGYETVHSKGSDFGSSFKSEQDVRNLLLRQQSAGFGLPILNGLFGLIGGIAAAIAEGVGRLFNGLASNFETKEWIEFSDTVYTALEPVYSLADQALDQAKEAQAKAEELTTKLDQQVTKLDTATSDFNSALDSLEKLTKTEREALEKRFNTSLAATNAAVEEVKSSSQTLEKNFDGLSSKVSTAQAAADSAITDAEKALDMLNNPIELGASLVAIDPATREPYWFEGTKPSTRVTPEGDKVRYMDERQSTPLSTDHVPSIPVDPRVKYRVSLWVWANEPGSRMYIEMRDQDGNHAVKSGSLGGSSTYLLQNLEVPTGNWHKLETVIEFKETVQAVRISRIYWNHSNGDVVTTQRIGGIRIYPEIPNQSEIDSLKAQSQTLSEKVEANLSKVNDATTKADEALSGYGEVSQQLRTTNSSVIDAKSNAEKALDWLKNPSEIGASLITIDPETKRPHWAKGLVETDQKSPDGDIMYSTDKPKNTQRVDTPAVTVDPRVRYRVSFWTNATDPGSVFYIQLQDEIGDGNIIKSGSIGRYSSVYLVNSQTIPAGEFVKHETVLEFKDHVSAVSIRTFYWNHYAGDPTTQFFGGFKIYPEIPTQASVDEAQNKAIAAQLDATKALSAQVEIVKDVSAANTKAINAQADATKALNAQVQIIKDISAANTKAAAAQADATKALTEQVQIIKDVSAANSKATTALAAGQEAQKAINDNQANWNKGTELALAAQKQVNDFNLINWQTQAEYNAQNNLINQAQNEALMFHENQLVWMAETKTRSFGVHKSYLRNEWLSLSVSPDLTADYRIATYGTWQGTIQVIMTNTKGNSDSRVYTIDSSERPIFNVRTGEVGAGGRDIVVVMNPAWGNRKREYLLKSKTGSMGFEPTDAYINDIEGNPISHTQSSGAIMFKNIDVVADQDTRVSTSIVNSGTTYSAGKVIPKGYWIVDSNYSQSRVVKFTEA